MRSLLYLLTVHCPYVAHMPVSECACGFYHVHDCTARSSLGRPDRCHTQAGGRHMAAATVPC